MNPFIDESIANMLRTEASTTYKNMTARMQHAIMGIADESGELIKIMLQSVYYNTPVDTNHYKEELGDLWWYLCLAVDDIAESEQRNPKEVFQEILRVNKAKLKTRYPEGYSNKQANIRDVHKERKIMHQVSDNQTTTKTGPTKEFDQ